MADSTRVIEEMRLSGKPRAGVTGQARCSGARLTGLQPLAETLGPRVRRAAPLASFTSMRVGGPADLLLVVRSASELAQTVRAARAHRVPFRVLGGGCNVLIADRGMRGLVIINRAASLSFSQAELSAESGAKLAVLARESVGRCLAGLSWAAGLPGTVGGAVVGNAGAFEGDVASTLRSGMVLGPDDEVVERASAWFDFSYRGSRLKRDAATAEDVAPDYIVLEATFALQEGDETNLRERADEVLAWRRTHHPTGATMGSTFKNPPGAHAGALIDRAGLKGYRVGGARVSRRHANFIVSDGDATAADVMAVIQHVRSEVVRQFGVALELEVELLGW